MHTHTHTHTHFMLQFLMSKSLPVNEVDAGLLAGGPVEIVLVSDLWLFTTKLNRKFKMMIFLAFNICSK